MAQKQQFEKVYEDGWGDDSEQTPADREDGGAHKAHPVPAAPEPAAIAREPVASPAPAKPQPAAPAPACSSIVPPAPAPTAIPKGPQLAPWPARDRPGLYPALFSRSALFQVGRGKRDRSGAASAPTPRSVACQGEHELTVDGPRLSMRDKAVWEFALDRARGAGQVGAEFELPLRACVLSLGATKDRKAESLRRARESLERLAATTLRYELSTGEKGACKLLGRVEMRDKACVVALDPDIVGFLAVDFLFATGAARRRALDSDIAKWLHDFHSTHEQFDGAFSPDTLRTLCGYGGQASQFPSLLQSALAELKAAAPELVAEFAVDKPTSKAKSWRVSVTRGGEVVRFEMPEREWRKRGRRASL